MSIKSPKVLVLATSRHTHGGISSVVMAHESSDTWKSAGCMWIATHRNGSKLTKLLYFLSGFSKYLIYLPTCSAVHMHIGEAPSAIRKSIFMRLAKIFGKKTLVHFHAFDTASTIEGPRKEVYRSLFNDADRIIVLSDMWKETVCRTFDVRDKVNVLYNPCPVIPRNTSETVKQNIILSAGVITPRKGYHDLIRAFAKIAGRHPNWKIVFAGSGEVDKGQEIAREAGIEHQVEFPGWVAGEQKDSLFRSTSIFCLPSYAEGFPMAVLDAWAYGLPVVTTPVGGLPDIIHDGMDVLLFTPGDTDHLSKQLDRLINDKALRDQIEYASNEFASKQFNIETIGDKLGQIYFELLREKH